MTNLFFDLEEGWFEIFELVRTFLCRRAPFWLAVRLSSDLSYATAGPAQKQKTDKPTHFGPKKLLRPDFLNQYSQKRQFSGSFVLFSHLSEKRDLRLRTRSSHAVWSFLANLRPDMFPSFWWKANAPDIKWAKSLELGLFSFLEQCPLSLEMSWAWSVVCAVVWQENGAAKGVLDRCEPVGLYFSSAQLLTASANVHRRLKIATAEICVWPRRGGEGEGGISRLKASEERREKWEIWGRRRN